MNRQQRTDANKLKSWTRNSKSWPIPKYSAPRVLDEDLPDTRTIIPNKMCPSCNSRRIVWAKYHDRLECKDCGRVFS